MSDISKDKLLKWVRVKLGYPTVKVELTDDQLEVCIEDALSELAPWIGQKNFVTLPASTQIDMTEYSAEYVIRVHKASSSNSSSKVMDPFDPISSMMTCSSTGGNVFTTMSMINTRQKTFLQYKDNISFKYIKPHLYLDVGVPSSSQVVVEYSKEVTEVTDIKDKLYIDFLKRFTLVYARLLLADIRGKYTVRDSPSQLDADVQRSQANSDLSQIREQLRASVPTDFIID